MRKYTTDSRTQTHRAVNYTIKAGRNSRLIHVIPNVNVHPHLQDHPEISAKLRACLRANIVNNCQAGYAELHTHQNVLDWVSDLADKGYEFAVIWSDGCWPHGEEFENTLTELSDTVWAANWIAAGKIINKKSDGEYLHWDYSYPVVINLAQWERCGQPYFLDDSGESISFDTGTGDANEQSPFLVTPASWFEPHFKDLERRGLFVDAIIGQGLQQKQIVIGLDSTDVDQHVHSDDLTQGFDEMLTWIHLNDPLAHKDIYEWRSGSDAYAEPRKEFFTFKILELQIVYITNTEGVPKDFKDTARNGFNTLILPCSGLHQFYHIIHNRDTLKRVVWFDFNPYSVKWMQHIIENWDGINFKKFVEENRHVITDSGEINEECIIYDPEMVDEFMETMDMTDDEWQDFIYELRDKENIFANVDAVKDYKTLVEHAGTDSEVFIQLTNIWQYEVNYLNTDGLDAQLAFINLLNDISKNNKNLYLTGDTPMGTHYRYKNIKELKGIF
jgi:hypothetical protein